MNKRLVKKTLKKKEQVERIISVSGNKGGDVLNILDNTDGTIHLFSGHCCVVTIDKTVPVEFLTALLSKVMLEYNNDVRLIIDSLDWPEKFKEELMKKVK